MQLIVNPGAHWNPGDRHSPEASMRNMETFVADLKSEQAPEGQ